MPGLVSDRVFARLDGSSPEEVPAAARGADLLPTPPPMVVMMMTMTTMNWMRREVVILQVVVRWHAFLSVQREGGKARREDDLSLARVASVNMTSSFR